MSITPDVLEQIADELHGIPDNEAKISFPCPTHGAFAASISLTGPEKLEAACVDGCEPKALWPGLVKESATLARLWAERKANEAKKKRTSPIVSSVFRHGETSSESLRGHTGAGAEAESSGTDEISEKGTKESSEALRRSAGDAVREKDGDANAGVQPQPSDNARAAGVTAGGSANESQEKEEQPKARASGPAAEVKHYEKSGLMQPPRPETQEEPGYHREDYEPPRGENDILRRVPPQNIEAEQSFLGAILLEPSVFAEASRLLERDDFYKETHREIFGAMLTVSRTDEAIDAVTLTHTLRTAHLLEAVGGAGYIAELAACVPTAAHIKSYAKIIRECADKRAIAAAATALASQAYNGSTLPQLSQFASAVVPARAHQEGRAIIMETQDQSMVVNEEYLARPEIIEGLGYSQSIMLFIGGKHSGKTTNLRTMALSVARGLPIWGRKTTGGPVIYAASDDEIVSTRNELLQMGWQKDDPLYLARMAEEVDPERLLVDLGDEATRRGAVMIIVDMLFDFVGIRDEMSYAGTREAINRLQHLADRTSCLVVASHHTPKYLNDAHNASNAALGSQGISARFSPIVMVRKWTETLFTIESTATRDPRGKALAPQRIARLENGWIEGIGEFKEWMKWQMYADRVMGLFEGGDPKAGYSVQAVADKLEIDRARAQNALYQLTQEAKLTREKTGRGYRYYLPNTSMFDREGGNFSKD